MKDVRGYLIIGAIIFAVFGIWKWGGSSAPEPQPIPAYMNYHRLICDDAFHSQEHHEDEITDKVDVKLNNDGCFTGSILLPTDWTYWQGQLLGKPLARARAMKKTQKLLDTLRKDWPWPAYSFIPEFRGGTGWSRESRADAIAMDLWPSKGLELIGFELKTSRQDWLRELKQPEKCEAIKQFCDRWYLVVDDLSIVRNWPHNELPEDWGLIVPSYSYNIDGRLETKKEAPKLKPKPIDRIFLSSLMRLASRDFSEVIIEGKKYVAERSVVRPE